MFSFTFNFVPNYVVSSLNNFFETKLHLQTRWNALIDVLHKPEIELFNFEFASFNVVPTYIFLLNIFFLFLFVVLFFVSFYGFKLIKTFSDNFDLNYVLFYYFSDLEEEVGAPDDFLFYILIFAAIIVWFFLLTLFTSVFAKSLNWVILLLVGSLATVFVVPTFLLKSFGIAFTTYVRGHGRTTSLFYETSLDFVSIFIIFVRFAVQNIRFVFIFFTFFELYEFIYLNLHSLTSITGSDYISFYHGQYNFRWSELLLGLLSTWGLYLYYLGHATIIFLAQLAVYFALSFWLFFFLYSTFVLESTEKYFFDKRALWF